MPARLAIAERSEFAVEPSPIPWHGASHRAACAPSGGLHPTPGETTDEEKAECERLHVCHDELVNMDEDEWTDELAAEGEVIETHLAEIDTAIEARQCTWDNPTKSARKRKKTL